MRSIIKSMLFIVVILVVMTACSKTKETQPPLSENQRDEVEEKESKEDFVAPFTGMIFEEEKNMRPVLATISNDPKARPQSGLSEADIIYELLVEGNTTRYLALFQSALPEEIGPIRSSRDMFIRTAKELDAFYVAHGYSPDAFELLQAGYVDHVNGMQHDGTLFERSQERYAPHNSYISNDNILLAAEQVNAPMTIDKMPTLSFHASIEDVTIENDATSITVQNGSHPQFTSNYTYDNQSGIYTQSVNDSETIDKANEQTIELANIFVIEAEHKTIDAEGRQSIDFDTGGKAMLFQAGKYEEVEWKNVNGTLNPVKDGVPIKLVPGKTWIHVLRTDPGIETNVSHTP